MDNTDKEFLEKYQKSQFEPIKPIDIINDKIYFHWSSNRIFSLHLYEVDNIYDWWLFGKVYSISVYTFMNKAVEVK